MPVIVFLEQNKLHVEVFRIFFAIKYIALAGYLAITLRS